jgi:hypothetical protein
MPTTSARGRSAKRVEQPHDAVGEPLRQTLTDDLLPHRRDRGCGERGGGAEREPGITPECGPASERREGQHLSHQLVGEAAVKKLIDYDVRERVRDDLRAIEAVKHLATLLHTLTGGGEPTTDSYLREATFDSTVARSTVLGA